MTEQLDSSLQLNVPSSVTFATDQYAITPAFAPLLNDLASTLNQNPQITASAVTARVRPRKTRRCVAGDRLGTQGMGTSNPVVDNATEAGRAQNRRVEIYLRAPQQ